MLLDSTSTSIRAIQTKTLSQIQLNSMRRVMLVTLPFGYSLFTLLESRLHNLIKSGNSAKL